MSLSEDSRRALELKRALLRARDLEIARAKQLRAMAAQLRATAAITVSQSKDVVGRTQELLDELHELRQPARGPLRAQDALLPADG